MRVSAPSSAILCCLLSAAAGSLLAWQINASPADVESARNQEGRIITTMTPSLLPGPYHSMADMKRALQTADAVFGAYARAPLLNPPRGFEFIHNTSADARELPKGAPIRIGSEFILLEFDPSRRSANGRFATIGEGPSGGGFNINSPVCANGINVIDDWAGRKFYYAPTQTGTVHGWPVFGGKFGGIAYLSRRTKPLWLPASQETVLNAMIAKARADLKTAMGSDSLRPRNAYDTFMKEKDKRQRERQQQHDELAKTNKELADRVLAQQIEVEAKMEKQFAEMAAKQGSNLNQQVDAVQARAAKRVQDLEAQLNVLSPEQRAAPAYTAFSGDRSAAGVAVYENVVPPGTDGAKAVVYANPDYYDTAIPVWEAQSICVTLSVPPLSATTGLFPTIQKIFDSLDWDAIAKVLK